VNTALKVPVMHLNSSKFILFFLWIKTGKLCRQANCSKC